MGNPPVDSIVDHVLLEVLKDRRIYLRRFSIYYYIEKNVSSVNSIFQNNICRPPLGL